ncbi:pyridoxamine 5'-phosphate oxidase family protein [Chloroflexota bacterium]
MVNQKLKETVLKYLEEHYTMTMATAKDGVPWAAALFYASDGFTLYFLSEPECRHSKDIAGNPEVAVTINEDYRDWREIKGIQMYGKAELVTTEDEMAKAVAVYAAKYPFTATFMKLMSSPFPRIIKYLDKFISKLPSVPSFSTPFDARFYKMVPTKVRFIDNERNFAQPEEFTLQL